MNQSFQRTVFAAAIAMVPCSAAAWEYRSRFVERIGTLDIPLENDRIDASSGEPRRIRLQYGVFDDDNGSAPTGGFIGWNVGVIDVSGTPENSQERRTPGWLHPFTFASGQFANGNPPPANGRSGPDTPNFDFQRLTDINATMGTQALDWLCNPDGTPTPMPPATVRGLNSYVSIYEITINPHPGASNYAVTYTGNLFAAREWRIVGEPTPPDCGDPGIPGDDVPGQVVYAPFAIPPSFFECTLQVLVPAPPSVAIAGGACLCLLRRRRTIHQGGER